MNRQFSKSILGKYSISEIEYPGDSRSAIIKSYGYNLRAFLPRNETAKLPPMSTAECISRNAEIFIHVMFRLCDGFIGDLNGLWNKPVQADCNFDHHRYQNVFKILFLHCAIESVESDPEIQPVLLYGFLPLLVPWECSINTPISRFSFNSPCSFTSCEYSPKL